MYIYRIYTTTEFVSVFSTVRSHRNKGLFLIFTITYSCINITALGKFQTFPTERLLQNTYVRSFKKGKESNRTVFRIHCTQCYKFNTRTDVKGCRCKQFVPTDQNISNTENVQSDMNCISSVSQAATSAPFHRTVTMCPPDSATIISFGFQFIQNETRV